MATETELMLPDTQRSDTMIKTTDAISTARSLLSTPYSTLDCINLIKRIIRTAPGGDPDYTTAGTNALWDSYDASPKYRDLIWRRSGIAGAQAGMLAFKASGEDYHHVGLVTGEGTVIHASSVKGETVETPLTEGEGWTHIAQHRLLAIAGDVDANEPEDRPVLFRATVLTASGALNLRSADARRAPVIGQIPKGAVVSVYEKGEALWQVGYNGQIGWAAEEYLSRIDEEDDAQTYTAIARADGTTIYLRGRWHIAED